MGTSMSQFSLDPNQIVDVDVYIDVDVDLGLEILDVVDFIFVIFFVRRSCETLLDHEYFVYKLSYSLRIKHNTLPPERTQPKKLPTANFSSGTLKTLSSLITLLKIN